MLKLILLLTITWQFTIAADADQNAGQVQTAEHVDLERYLGKWFEIASMPQFFQRKCVSNTVAEYSLAEKDRIEVFNSCTDKDGQRKSATGSAKVADTNSNAKLKVTFLKIGTWIYWAGGNYWILEVEPDYRWAIVGEKSRKYGWILSREPVLDLSELKVITAKIKAQGYDTCLFLTTIQDGGFKTKQPLCDVVEH